MHLKFSSVSALSFLALFRAYAQPISNGTTASISWFPCPQNESLPFDCGNLTVPLDYTDPSSGQSLTLSLVKVNATKMPFKGSILFNPGGPGGIGRSMFVNSSDEYFLNRTGGHFDLISFDPRGTGDTIPFSCYASNDSYSRILSTIATPYSTNSSDTAPGTIWADRTVYAENCLTQQNETGRYIGTAFVARDMMQIVDALGEDGLLRYWGFSYGTMLGATVAAMFPDRMDRVLLDGVVNAHEWGSDTPVETAVAADGAFASFVQACAAAPDECILARNGADAQDLHRKIDMLLDEIKYQPLVLGPVRLSDVVDYGYVKYIIWQGLYTPPQTWPLLAGMLDSIFQRNVTGWQFYSTALAGSHASDTIFPSLGSDAERGIRCSDVFSRSDNLTSLMPLLSEIESSSHYVSDVYSSVAVLTCSQWLMDAKERYTGNFEVQTKNPIMLIGNPLDPVTPLVSAQNVSAGFSGSVVLQHNGGGHTSQGEVSTCTWDVILAYFNNGTLPAPGTQCSPDKPTFGGTNIASE